MAAAELVLSAIDGSSRPRPDDPEPNTERQLKTEAVIRFFPSRPASSRFISVILR